MYVHMRVSVCLNEYVHECVRARMCACVQNLLLISGLGLQ